MPLALRHLGGNRGRGYLPDRPDRNDTPFAALGIGNGHRVALPVRIVLPLPFVLDQGGTSSCVAHAVAHAIGAREAVRGLEPVVPSREWIYYWARYQHGGQHQDRGTYLRTAADALRRLGAPDEARWPWKPITTLHTQPGLQAVSGAAGRRGGSYYRINEVGDARMRAIQLSIAQGMPVVFGTEVAQSFLPSQGPAVIDAPRPGEPMAGGHAMCIHGVRTDATGLQVRMRNSWGNGWRDDGGAWLTEAFMARARDLWAIDTFRRAG